MESLIENYLGARKRLDSYISKKDSQLQFIATNRPKAVLDLATAELNELKALAFLLPDITYLSSILSIDRAINNALNDETDGIIIKIPFKVDFQAGKMSYSKISLN